MILMKARWNQFVCYLDNPETNLIIGKQLVVVMLLHDLNTELNVLFKRSTSPNMYKNIFKSILVSHSKF